MASFSWFYFLHICTSAPHTNLPLSFLDLLFFLAKSNFLGTFGTNEPLQDSRLCHLSLSSFFPSLLSLLSSCILNTPTRILTQNFQVLLQSLPHDQCSKLDATIIRTLNALFDYFIRFKLCVCMLDFTGLS